MQHATVRFGRQGDEVVEEEEIGERVTHGVDVAQIANVTNVIVETSVILLWKQQGNSLLLELVPNKLYCRLAKEVEFFFYVVGIEMRASRIAIVGQVAKLVNVQAVKAGSQPLDSPANDDGSTCRRLSEVNLAAHSGKVSSALDIHHGRNWSLLLTLSNRENML